MSGDQLLEQLRALGTEQARKTYRRHGVTGEQYGVSYTDLKKLKKSIKINHDLALDLWASGVHDARLLALMIADPQRADSTLLDAWVQQLENYPLTDAFTVFVAQTSLARAKMEQWITSDGEWVGATAWNLLRDLATQDTNLPDDYFAPYLTIISRDLHSQKNRVRHAMNSALIAIGARNPQLRAQALTSAATIGKVVVDHGDTNCKTLDAKASIEKAWAQRLASV